MHRSASLLLMIVVISAFGPYLVPFYGIRFEHFVIYTLFLYLILTAYYLRLKIPNVVLMIVFLWHLLLAWILFATITSEIYLRDYYDIIAALENVLQPIALIMIITFIINDIPKDEIEAHFFKVTSLIVALLVVNTLWIILGTYVNLTFINIYFWAGRGAEIATVAQSAASMGRYSGIINQPLESGQLYSIGLICWAYLTAKRGKINIIWVIVLILLSVGGLFSVSKVFLFGGLPLFILYMLEEKKAVLLNLIKYTLIIPFAFAIDLYLNYYWVGYSYMLRYSRALAEKQLFQTIFSTRYGSDDTAVISGFKRTWDVAPISGFGFGRFMAYDNAYLEFFMYGGSIALLLYSLILIVLLLFPIIHYNNITKLEVKTLFLLILLAVIAGTGGATLIANRVSVLYWVLICMLIYIVKFKHKDKIKFKHKDKISLR